ncbi:MAG: tRNA 2-thiocytidine biosynthesis protein TtcA [Firmicutes bacterium]|nr:tRNA 2-thiocytidine biosynthesis protein TtcA [Bacillota bacterium]
MNEKEQIEKSIIKKYRKEIWRPFVKAINEYELIKENDKIAVCISGGKDSFLMAKCFQELKKHGKIKFDLKFIVMNPGYNEKNGNLITTNAEKMGIPIHVFKTEIFDVVAGLTEGNPCYLCARMRRGHLYNTAKELGCNKIALGHHFDDVIETILLSMFYSGEIKTMMPKLHSDNYENMELIRPMYLVKERDIKSWVKYNNLEFLNCACRFTESCNIDESASKRLAMKRLIEKLREDNPYIEKNIFKSVANINLSQIIGYHKEDYEYNFLDDYE